MERTIKYNKYWKDAVKLQFLIFNRDLKHAFSFLCYLFEVCVKTFLLFI